MLGYSTDEMCEIGDIGLKYKVGDKVKIVGLPRSLSRESFIGVVGVISEVDIEDKYLRYKVNGDFEGFKDTWWFAEENLELVEGIQESAPTTKVKSDGGSSSYYFSKLPQQVIDRITEKGGIEIKDVVKYCFYNDADCKDIIKALKRIMEDLRGGGKEGIDAYYDMNKIRFFLDEVEDTINITKGEIK